MASKVFISWGGDLSKQLAEVIRDWLPCVLQFVKPYFTPDDIEKGARWESDITQELSDSNIGLICLTKDNLNRPWILFEAGALSKRFEHAHVCTLLFNIETAQIEQPLASFQSTSFNKKDFKKLVETINKTGEDASLSIPVLDSVFEMWWPQLEDKINLILSNYQAINSENISTEAKQDDRSQQAILNEILDIVRFSAKQSPQKNNPTELIALRDLMHTLERIIPHIQKNENYLDHVNQLYMSIDRMCHAVGKPHWFNTFLRNIREQDTYADAEKI